MSIAPPPPPERGSDATLLLAALAGLAKQLPVDTVDELWIFPARRSGEIESVVLVASAFVPDDAERRRIVTTHLTARREQGRKAARMPAVTPAESIIVEQGVAPADRIERVVNGVMRRLDEELAALPPRPVKVGGESAAWDALVAEIGEAGK